MIFETRTIIDFVISEPCVFSVGKPLYSVIRTSEVLENGPAATSLKNLPFPPKQVPHPESVNIKSLRSKLSGFVSGTYTHRSRTFLKGFDAINTVDKSD